MTPSKIWRSEPQIAQAVTFMMASRGCSIFGSGTVSQRRSFLPCQVSAFTKLSGGPFALFPEGQRRAGTVVPVRRSGAARLMVRITLEPGGGLNRGQFGCYAKDGD